MALDSAQGQEDAAQMFARDKAATTCELGPRSMALLRRLVLAVETIADSQFPDPGREFEDEAALYLAPKV